MHLTFIYVKDWCGCLGRFCDLKYWYADMSLFCFSGTLYHWRCFLKGVWFVFCLCFHLTVCCKVPSQYWLWMGRKMSFKRTILRITMYIKRFALTLLYKNMHIERKCTFVCMFVILSLLSDKKKVSLQFQSRISLIFGYRHTFLLMFLFLYTILCLCLFATEKYKIKLYLGWCFVIQSILIFSFWSWSHYAEYITDVRQAS